MKIHLKIEATLTFTNREIRQVLRTKATTLKRYHGQLLEVGLIRVKAGKRYKGYEYEIVDEKEYEQLQQDISTVLDQILEGLRQPTSPLVAHKQNGLPKRKKAS